jgi:hypothetical protein
MGLTFSWMGLGKVGSSHIVRIRRSSFQYVMIAANLSA